MTLAERVKRSGLNGMTSALLALALVLAVMHHTDHVLRIDHSSWPFRAAATPFTYTLLADPIILLALFGPQRWFWRRWGLLALGTAFTLLAHTVLGSPQMR